MTPRQIFQMNQWEFYRKINCIKTVRYCIVANWRIKQMFWFSLRFLWNWFLKMHSTYCIHNNIYILRLRSWNCTLKKKLKNHIRILVIHLCKCVWIIIGELIQIIVDNCKTFCFTFVRLTKNVTVTSLMRLMLFDWLWV